MLLLLLVATAFADLAEDEADVGHEAVMGKPTPGQYYSVTPIGSMLDPPAQLQGLTFNFDNTITTSDDLTIEVLKACHEAKVEVVTRKELIAAFDEIVEKAGRKKFMDEYMGGQRRVNTMKSALKKMRAATDNHVAILSASWGTSPKRPWLKAPIGEKEWAAYLLHLTEYVGLGFDEEHIIGVYAPGPPVIPEKGEALQAYYKEMYQTEPTNVVHIDKFKYASRILAVGGNLLQPDPYFVQQFSLNTLLVLCGGDQVSYWDILKEGVSGFLGRRRSEDEETEGMYYQQSSSGESFIVYGFAAVGLAAMVGAAYKAFHNRKLSEHTPITNNEPEL